MANAALAPNALQKPAKGSTARGNAARKRRQAKVDRLVYAAVDARDGQRCRVCHVYRGKDIQRHHVVYRSLGGKTTTANVVSLCGECHLLGVHRGRIKLSGNADITLRVELATVAWDGGITKWAVYGSDAR